MRRGPSPTPEIPEDGDSIILSVKLRSGRFESSIEVPLYASDEEKKEFVAQWLNLMEAGVKIGRANREAKKHEP